MIESQSAEEETTVKVFLGDSAGEVDDHAVVAGGIQVDSAGVVFMHVHDTAITDDAGLICKMDEDLVKVLHDPGSSKLSEIDIDIKHDASR